MIYSKLRILNMNNRHTDNRFASRRLVLLQDTALSVAATLLSVLLVRWLSDPIPGFSAILFRWLGASLVLTVASLWLVGSQRLVQRYATVRSSMRLAFGALRTGYCVGSPAARARQSAAAGQASQSGSPFGMQRVSPSSISPSVTSAACSPDG